MFEYQVLSMKTPNLFTVTTQNSQKKHDCECSLNSILNKNVRITKEKIQKKHRLSTSKTLQFSEWKASQVVVLDSFQCEDTKQNELTMKKDNNMTMNVDESDTH